MTFTDALGEKYELPKGEKVFKRISVYPIVFNESDELLVYMPKYNNQWQLPGGGLNENLNETIEQAIKRECLEETGHQIELINKNPIYKNKQNFYHRSEKKFYNSKQLFFEAKLISSTKEEVCENDKDGKVGWKKLEELNEENTHPIIRPVINLLKVK